MLRGGRDMVLVHPLKIKDLDGYDYPHADLGRSR